MSTSRPSDRLYNSFLAIVAAGSLSLSSAVGSHLWNNRTCVREAVTGSSQRVDCLNEPSKVQRRMQVGGVALTMLGAFGMVGATGRSRSRVQPKA